MGKNIINKQIFGGDCVIDFIKAIKRPFSDFRKFGLGFLFGLVPIVNLFVGGYSLACAKSAEKKKYELPEWREFGSLFLHGILGAVICFLYFVPAMIFMAACIGLMVRWLGTAYPWSAIAPVLSQPAEQMMPALETLLAGMPIGGIIVLLTAAFALLVLASYVLPSALLFYVNRWKFNDAFDFKGILRKAFTSNYFVLWLLIAVYSIAFRYAANYTIGLIPTIGAMMADSLAAFVIGVTCMTVFGELFYSKGNASKEKKSSKRSKRKKK